MNLIPKIALLLSLLNSAAVVYLITKSDKPVSKSKDSLQNNVQQFPTQTIIENAKNTSRNSRPSAIETPSPATSSKNISKTGTTTKEPENINPDDNNETLTEDDLPADERDIYIQASSMSDCEKTIDYIETQIDQGSNLEQYRIFQKLISNCWKEVGPNYIPKSQRPPKEEPTQAPPKIIDEAPDVPTPDESIGGTKKSLNKAN